MASTADHIEARKDTDILARLISRAEQLGTPQAQSAVESAIGRLVATPVQDGQTIADVLAYARATYVPTPRPGQNPAAVTDDHLATAIQAILNS